DDTGQQDQGQHDQAGAGEGEPVGRRPGPRVERVVGGVDAGGEVPVELAERVEGAAGAAADGQLHRGRVVAAVVLVAQVLVGRVPFRGLVGGAGQGRADRVVGSVRVLVEQAGRAVADERDHLLVEVLVEVAAAAPGHQGQRFVGTGGQRGDPGRGEPVDLVGAGGAGLVQVALDGDPGQHRPAH